MQYLPSLANAGLSVQVQSLFDDAYLTTLYGKRKRNPFQIIALYLKRLICLSLIRQVDVIWLEYELFPYLPAWFERWLVSRGIALVVDYDDAVFHNYDLSDNKLVRNLLSHKIDDVMRMASVVIAGNSYLENRAKQAGAKYTCVVPTVVDLLRYPSVSTKRPDSLLTVGWIGSPATQSYLKAIAPVLSEVLKRYNARLILIGATPELESDLPGCDLTFCQWSEASEVADIQRFDIGIMPLPDGPWERGKCGYKLVQYMACGIPVIASAVGANVEIVEACGSGYLAASADDWACALTSLLTDERLRQQFGAAGRLAVEQRFSLQAQVPELINIFNSVKRISAV